MNTKQESNSRQEQKYSCISFLQDCSVICPMRPLKAPVPEAKSQEGMAPGIPTVRYSEHEIARAVYHSLHTLQEHDIKQLRAFLNIARQT